MTSLGGSGTGTSSNSSIPTISAAVSSSSLMSKAAASSRTNYNDALSSITTRQIVQQKFKENENVLSVCLEMTLKFVISVNVGVPTSIQHSQPIYQYIYTYIFIFNCYSLFRYSRPIRLSVKNIPVASWLWLFQFPVALMPFSL